MERDTCSQPRVTARSLLRRLKKSPPRVVNARSGPEGYRNCESETKGCTRCRKRTCRVDVSVRSGCPEHRLQFQPNEFAAATGGEM
ncbi:hypothetical protein FJTKL_00304 [Diaporthe vaccinii]|uniref:Uncharacterized protein n=1 Tax=Diaporthe vaccinii TaxID=105482 RepID=A0ABR4E3M7_9PEZI